MFVSLIIDFLYAFGPSLHERQYKFGVVNTFPLLGMLKMNG